jgi:hypothetical protein
LAFFWPDADRASARQVLRTTLHGLRKSLGPNLTADEDTLALSPDAEVDARLFESHLHVQRPASNFQLLTSILQLYRGDFLEGFSLPDTPEFDDWVAVQRERYRRLAIRGRAAISQLHEAGHDYAAALDAIDELRTHGLVYSIDGTRFTFDHSLTMYRRGWLIESPPTLVSQGGNRPVAGARAVPSVIRVRRHAEQSRREPCMIRL